MLYVRRLTIRFPFLLLVPPLLVIFLIGGAIWAVFFRDGGGSTSHFHDYVRDIQSPGGLDLGLDGLLIGSMGTGNNDGAVYVARSKGDSASKDDLTKLVERLPSKAAASGSPPFLRTFGVTAVSDDAEKGIAIVVGGTGDPFGRVFRATLQPGAPAEEMARLDGRAAAFDAVRDKDGTLYVSEPLANKIERITPRGQVIPYVIFENIKSPDGQTFAAVPGGMCIGPDGAIYVALFSGEPYQGGRSRIYRLQDRNGDGDAEDSGEQTIAADGLTFAIDVAFGPDGILYALEFATALTGGPSNGPTAGRLWRLADDRTDLLADDLVTPVSLVIDERGRAFVAERDTGKVRILKNAAPVKH